MTARYDVSVDERGLDLFEIAPGRCILAGCTSSTPARPAASAIAFWTAAKSSGDSWPARSAENGVIRNAFTARRIRQLDRGRTRGDPPQCVGRGLETRATIDRMDRETAEGCTILRGLVGSTVHGLNVNDGIEDRDEMGICVEPLDAAMALGAVRAVHLSSAADRRPGQRTQHRRRTRPDDLQPSQVDAPRAHRKPDGPPAAVHARRSAGVLRCGRRRAARADVSDRLPPCAGAVPRLPPGTEAAPQRRTRSETNSPARARSDVRFRHEYAMHMLRLGFQGVELLTTGRLSLPMREPERSFLLDVRRGKVSEEACFFRAEALERELVALADTSLLPKAPDEARVEQWVLDVYRQRWATPAPSGV